MIKQPAKNPASPPSSGNGVSDSKIKTSNRKSQKKAKPSKPPVNTAKAVSGFLYRFHIVIFVVTVLGGIAMVIFLLNQTLTAATEVDQYQTTSSSTFDVETIERLNQLNDTPGQSEFRLPSGRTNPFSE